jgi:hypothetical protein
MKRDIAERMAATKICEDLTVKQAKAVIQEFLAQLAQCPVCDGTGEFIFGRDVEIDTKDHMGRPLGDRERRIEKGTTSSCPRCGGEKVDPEFVVWHCVHGDREMDCRHYKNGGNGSHKDHAECGHRVMLPLEVAG